MESEVLGEILLLRSESRFYRHCEANCRRSNPNKNKKSVILGEAKYLNHANLEENKSQ